MKGLFLIISYSNWRDFQSTATSQSDAGATIELRSILTNAEVKVATLFLYDLVNLRKPEGFLYQVTCTSVLVDTIEGLISYCTRVTLDRQRCAPEVLSEFSKFQFSDLFKLWALPGEQMYVQYQMSFPFKIQQSSEYKRFKYIPRQQRSLQFIS